MSRGFLSPVLRDLRIKRRIEFKILLLTFKCVHDITPSYLIDLVHKRESKETRAGRELSPNSEGQEVNIWMQKL